MIKRVEPNYIITIYEDLNIENNKAFHLVDVIKFTSDSTYSQNYLYYEGTLDTFKHMSDYHLANLIEKLLTKPKNSKFSLQKTIDYAIM